MKFASRRNVVVPIAALMGLMLLAQPFARAQPQAPTTAPAETSKFLRFIDDGNGGGRLEASVVSYRNAEGAQVDLIAAVHIADARFFGELNQSFTKYDSLLYEMIKPRGMPNTFPMHRPTTYPTTRSSQVAHSLGWVGWMQRFLTDNLNLTFQLDQIDYTRPNFVHADLDMETFYDMQEARGESMMSIMLDQMLHELANGSADAANQPGLADLLLALQSPDRARQLKLVLARQFSQMDEMMSGLDGSQNGQGTVIVTERNKAALRVLRKRLTAGDKLIGIFYGAAHLKGMEKIITQQMGFKQVGEPKWRTAWDMTEKNPKSENRNPKSDEPQGGSSNRNE